MGIRDLRGAGRVKVQKYLAERKAKTAEEKREYKRERAESEEERSEEEPIPKPNTDGYIRGKMCPFATSHLGRLRHLECIAHHCVMWDGKHSTCSLRTIPMLLDDIKK